MGFGKIAIFFFGMLFMLLIFVAAASVMLKDKPTDTIYVTNTSINSTTQIAGNIIKSMPGMSLPMMMIGIIVFLGAGLYTLSRKRR